MRVRFLWGARECGLGVRAGGLVRGLGVWRVEVCKDAAAAGVKTPLSPQAGSVPLSLLPAPSCAHVRGDGAKPPWAAPPKPPCAPTHALPSPPPQTGLLNTRRQFLEARLMSKCGGGRQAGASTSMMSSNEGRSAGSRAIAARASWRTAHGTPPPAPAAPSLPVPPPPPGPGPGESPSHSATVSNSNSSPNDSWRFSRQTALTTAAWDMPAQGRRPTHLGARIVVGRGWGLVRLFGAKGVGPTWGGRFPVGTNLVSNWGSFGVWRVIHVVWDQTKPGAPKPNQTKTNQPAGSQPNQEPQTQPSPTQPKPRGRKPN